MQDAVSKLPEGAPLPTVVGKDVEASHHDLSLLVRRLRSCGHPNSKLQNPNDSGFWILDFLASFGFRIRYFQVTPARRYIVQAFLYTHLHRPKCVGSRAGSMVLVVHGMTLALTTSARTSTSAIGR